MIFGLAINKILFSLYISILYTYNSIYIFNSIGHDHTLFSKSPLLKAPIMSRSRWCDEHSPPGGDSRDGTEDTPPDLEIN